MGREKDTNRAKHKTTTTTTNKKEKKSSHSTTELNLVKIIYDCLTMIQILCDICKGARFITANVKVLVNYSSNLQNDIRYLPTEYI